MAMLFKVAPSEEGDVRPDRVTARTSRSCSEWLFRLNSGKN